MSNIIFDKSYIFAGLVCEMDRKTIVNLCSYADQMVKDAQSHSELKETLLVLASTHLSTLLQLYYTGRPEFIIGYIYTRLGLLHLFQNNIPEAEMDFVEALANITTPGGFCQDRALAYWYLGIINLGYEKKATAEDYFAMSLQLYDSLAMYSKIEELEPEFNSFGYKIEDFIPTKEFTTDGLPAYCRICYRFDFKLIEEDETSRTYGCLNCGCHNVVLLDMLKEQMVIT